MFKIESYLTPIILNQVAKYVKDIRPQDAQLSLWEGEVSFQNLDMRLDVLEKELQLPFSLLSGHIHELNIHVPWTKITSEPVKITINTIEFVLKVKTHSCASARSSPNRRENQQRGSKSDDQQLQQGGLVNKIINNIVVNCHNIILKYVEEDIVVSMNVQLLSFCAADERWRPAMVDVHPVQVLTRKLVKISDLTICLDKTNEAGQIEVCQEPVLYRCSLECRILLKYNVNTRAMTSTTRIGLFTQSLDVNISSLQFPLILRLAQLILSMKSRQLNKIAEQEPKEDFDSELDNGDANEESYLSWAWNLLPSFNFDAYAEEQSPEDSIPGHTRDIGVYIERLNFTLKNSIFVNDTVMGASKRFRYKPIVRISLGGIYYEMVHSAERQWSNIKTGLTSIVVEPLGKYRSDDNAPSAVIDCSCFEIGNSFIDKSLFDEQCLIADKGWGVTNYEDYSTRITDEYLLFRSPIFAFDLVEYRLANERSNNEPLLEPSAENHVQYRLLSSGLTFRYNQSVLQVIQIILDYVESYEYPSYYVEINDDSRSTSMTKMHPPLLEDFDALMLNIPMSSFKFQFTNMNFEFYATTNELLAAGSGLKTTAQKRLPNNLKKVLPIFLLHFDSVEGYLKTPIDPETLVHLTCQLPLKPKELVEACYDNYTINVKNLFIALQHMPTTKLSKVVIIPKTNIKVDKLLMPKLWYANEDVATFKLACSIEQFDIEFSKQEIIAMSRLIHSIVYYDPSVLWSLAKMEEALQLKNEVQIKLKTSFSTLTMLMLNYCDSFGANVQLQSIASELICPIQNSVEKFEFLRACYGQNDNRGIWLEIQAKLPKDLRKRKPGLHKEFALWLDKFIISIDPHFIKFLEYCDEDDTKFEKELSTEPETIPPTLPASASSTSATVYAPTSSYSLQHQLGRRSSRNYSFSERQIRKISHPEETIHFSSDREEVSTQDNIKNSSVTEIEENEKSYVHYLKIIKKFAVIIEINQSELSFGEGKTRKDNNRSITDFTRIKLPSVQVKSLNAYIIERSNIRRKLTLRRYSQKGTYNWTIHLKNFIIQNCSPDGAEDLVEPIQTVITIALTHKAEHVWKLKLKSQEPRLNLPKASPIPIKSSDNQFDESDDSVALSDNTQLEFENRRRSLGSLNSESIIFQAGKDFVTLNVHADTTPIHFLLSTHKLKALQSNLKVLLKVCGSFGSYPSSRSSQSNNNSIEIITAAEENASIKEFLELETNSEASAASDGVVHPKVSASLLCQWAITKIVFEIESGSIGQKYPKKCLLELEDLLSTIDVCNDYTKQTCKVGQFSLRYLELNSNGEWIVNEGLQIKMRTTDSNTSPFLNIIVTTVAVKDFYKKIGIKRRGDNNRSISELCVFLEALEIVLDMQIFANFVDPLCFLFQSEEKTAKRTTNVKGIHAENPIWTAEELPMIHVNSKGLILYLPVRSGNDCCSVSILKIEKIDITPNLENPLQRNPLRADLYNKASQLGILSTPGSIIEDRQYELILQNISVASGDWQAILEQMRELTNTRLSNPAFEWNNQYRRTSPQLADIFNNFKFHSIFAPCIVYNKILVCGQAVEFNCASDFVVSLTMHQINLISCLIVHLNNITEILSGYCNDKNEIETINGGSVDLKCKIDVEKQASGSGYSLLSSQSTNFGKHENPCGRERKRNMFYETISSFDSNRFHSIDESSEQNTTQISDSGFYSCLSNNSATNMRINSKERFFSIVDSLTGLQQERQDDPKPTATLHMQRHIPQTISLVTGQFIIQIFDVDKTQRFTPLCSLTISQPCFMIAQNIYESTTQLTIFDFFLQIANFDDDFNTSVYENLAKFVEESENSGIDLFPHTIIHTKQGKQSSSGIPPPLFSYKSQKSKKQLLEVNIELSKPIVCLLSEKCIEQLSKQFVLVNEVLLENPCFEIRSRKPVVRGSKIKLMRHQLFDADRFYCKFDSIVLKYFNTNEYNCKLEVADFRSNIKFLMRPEKAIGKLTIGAVYLVVDQKIVLHPVELRMSTELVTEPWHSLPLITANAKLNVLQINACVHELIKLRRAVTSLQRILGETNEEWQEFLRNRPTYEVDTDVNMDNLVSYKYPAVNKGNQHSHKPKQRDEFYQDDLRAGAFQFVEMITDSFLPLPYQIQIIKKNFGIICWRYPQPRKMCRIQIFPVPMAVPNPIHIKCRMEYFSEAHENFLHYCDFLLSETVSKKIELPKRAICANIWRVVIMQSLVSINGECFDANEEDDELNSITTIKIDDALSSERKESEFILHPKVLVGCMRIDTSFQSESVPKFQLLISLNMIKLNFLNQPSKDIELPKMLKDYKLAQSTEISQTFMILTLERFNIYWAFLAPTNNILSFDMTFNIKCMDYGFLNMVYLLEESSFHSYIHANQQKNVIHANMIVDKICLNFNASTIHTLLSSKMHWEEYLEVEEGSQRRHHAFLSKFVIVNQTFSHIAFGQSETTERIQLNPKEVHMYAFRSNCFSQELTFFVADDETRITEASQPVPISLKFEGTKQLQHIRVGNKCLLLKMQKLSTTQMLVLIKGQIELISFVLHDFRIEIASDGGRNDVKNALEYTIEQKSRCSFFRNVQQTSNATMRLKLLSGKGRGRSGDIPLKTNKCLPWLVKVPYQNNNFISFWVRILREDIPDFNTEQFRPQRVLITIWPIFEIRSLLTCVLRATDSSNNHQKFEVEPEGGLYLLNVPATHLTEHTVKLDSELPLEKHVEKQYTVSLKFIDWNNFFWYDEQSLHIEDALDVLSEDDPLKRPFNGDEEERIKRISQLKSAISINYSCAPSRDFSCSMCLSVAPSGLFVNATGLEVSVCNIDTKNRIIIASNAMEMLFAINTAFTLEIKSGKVWIPSLPIYFKETTDSATNKYYVAFEDIGSEIVILYDNKVLKFILDLKVEDERKVLTLRSKYNVTNFTKLSLLILPFTLDHKESSTRADIKMLDSEVQLRKIDPVMSSRNCIGVPLDSFHDLNAAKSLRSSDTAFVCFVCIKLSPTSDFSIPIPLTMQFARKCFSLQDGSESIPLVVTLIETSGIFYLSIFDDPSPAVLINNQTEMKLMVARTSASENSKVTNTTPEYDGKHFEWYQRVAPFSKCYYTPPEMYSNFPDVESTTYNLTLALWNGSCAKKSVHWSKPIRTDKTWEKFLHIPNHGDVKVIICDKHNIIRVSIFYILQQQEFSVKDLRSRLLTPPAALQPPESELVTSLSGSSITTLLNPAPTEPAVTASYKCQHFRNDFENIVKPIMKLRCFIREIHVNLKADCKENDFKKKDIFALCIDECMLAYDDDFDERQLNVLFANLQIDNQLFSTGNYDFPVVFCAQEIYKRQTILPQLDFLNQIYEDLIRRQPMIKLLIKFFDDELKISEIDCSVSPVRAYIEDAYVNDLLDALVECVPSNCVYQMEEQQERITLNAGQMLLPRKITEQSICMAEPMKLKSFRIQPLDLLLSVHTSVRLYIALDHSPLSFSSYERQQILTVPLRFGQSVGMHYLSGAIFGAGWVVGSLEILGSPSGLARSFSTGLRDFVSMPVRGLFRGPWGFIVGITQGSASLLCNVTAGTVNSMTKLAASVARNLDRLSLDQDHIDRTDALRRSRPQGFTEGFSQGVTGLGISILGAVGGIARHTLEARTPAQVVTGVGKGIVGAVTKPISGAAELLALTGQGVLQSVGFNAMPHQRSVAPSWNVTVEPSDYRIWKLLPSILSTDQILFYQEVTLVERDQLKRAYVFLTSTVFAVIEAKWEKLSFVLPVDKVEISADTQDKSMICVRIAKEREVNEEDQNYTNQRIMTFLRSSFHSSSSNSALANDPLNDLMQIPTQTDRNKTNLDWSFYINEHLGEYLIGYLKIMHKNIR